VVAMESAMDVGTLQFCGIEDVTHRFFYAVPYVTDEVRHNMLQEVKQLVDQL
jgi:NAD(P)H dehydrogenase (quinone)